jgi:glutamyl-tRNA synthetase
MSRRELIEGFALEGISGGNAVFDTAKLHWLNGQYIARMPPEQLGAAVVPLLVREGLWPKNMPTDEWLLRLLELLRPRAKRLTDFVEQARPFLVETIEYEADAITKHLGSTRLSEDLTALIEALRTGVPFDEQHVEAAVRNGRRAGYQSWAAHPCHTCCGDWTHRQPGNIREVLGCLDEIAPSRVSNSSSDSSAPGTR